MSNLEKARASFRAFDKARIDELFHGGPAVDEAAFGYKHGWIILNGESFNRERCFPNEHHPRFPADQGTSD